MKTLFTRVIAALALFALWTNCLAPLTMSQQVNSIAPFTFDKSAYEKQIHTAFDGKVMGYETVLLKNGQIVSEVANGLARNPADGNVKMTTSIPANIGSAFKFVSGVALLHLFEGKVNGRLSMDHWLSQPIYPYFPKVWQDGMDPSIKQITFRHLLQHRSGFRSLSTEDMGDDGQKMAFDYLRKGVSPADFNVRSYSNANFTLLTFLIPMLVDPLLLATVNQEAVNGKWTAEGLPIHKRIASVWEQYIRVQLFNSITPTINPSCEPSVELANRKLVWAPDYTSVNDTGKGATRNSRSNNGFCHAAGGWYISARELAAFVANFNATNTLVSLPSRTLMYDDDHPNDRLVWSFTTPATPIKAKFDVKNLPYMGGDQGGAHASVLMLPGGYYAIGIINSNDMSSNGVAVGTLGAFKAGIGL